MNMSFGIRIDKKSAGSGQEKKKKRSETEIPDRIWQEQAAHKNTKKTADRGKILIEIYKIVSTSSVILVKVFFWNNKIKYHTQKRN